LCRYPSRKQNYVAGWLPFLIILGLCFTLAVSCATTSPATQEEGKYEAVENRLPSGAVMYGFAGIRHLGTVIGSLGQFNDKQTADFIKKTEFAFFGLYHGTTNGSSAAAQSVYLITKGNYPAFSYNFGLGLSPKWKSTLIDGKKWWKQGTTALLIEKNEAYIRLGDAPMPKMASPELSREEPTALFRNARRSLAPGSDEPAIVLASFIPSSETAGFIRRLGIPLDITLGDITLSVAKDTKDEESYRSTLRLKTKSPSEAKAFSAILSLARTRFGKQTEAGTAFIIKLLFANPPVLDGNTIVISGDFPMDMLVRSIEQLKLF
jgi:hypothetical protein